MHQPRPYGLHGQIRSDEDAAAVESFVRQLTNIKTTGGVSSLRLVRDLPSGDTAIAFDMGGVLKVIIRPQEQAPPLDDRYDGMAKMAIPMLFSGVITNALFGGVGGGVGLRLTSQACKRIAGYQQDGGDISPTQSLRRFAIEYADRHAEFKPKNPSFLTHSQYVQLRPTWFSGRMATLVQIAGGYGRQDFSELPDNRIERARLDVPEKYAKRIREAIKGVRLPGYTGEPPQNGQIQFDYKFYSCNAVSYDSSGKPWLVRIGIDGVYAMPLPMVPATTTAAFREYMEEAGDQEIIWILDRFGGLPSGEGFPPGPMFQAWRRAGVIIKVCDTGNFYKEYSYYSTACGWSANTSGSNLVNTAYTFGDDGIQIGVTYMMSLSLSPAKDDGRLSSGLEVADEFEARSLGAYMSALYGALKNDPKKGVPIKYKLSRVESVRILARSRQYTGGDISAEVDYWDNLEVDPIASHSGSVREIGRGKLWAPGFPKSHPQIKFAEPMMEGCVSHDFGRLEGSPPPSVAPRCDTIMHAYYSGDDLKVVKYFRDDRGYFHNVEDNFEDCMDVGSWQQTITTGSTSLMGHFYTSDIDDRKVAAPQESVTVIQGSDLGFDDPPNFAFDFFFSMVGSLWRNRYFQHISTTKTTEGYSLAVAVCMPYLNRSGVFRAKKETTTGGSSSESLSVHAVGDPNSYRFETYDFVMHWVGGNYRGNSGTAEKVDPHAKNGSPVWVRGYNYAPYKCGDFADQGSWAGLPSDWAWLIHPKAGEWKMSGGGSPPKVKPYSRSETLPSTTSSELVVSFRQSVDHINKSPRDGYFTISPNENGDVFYVDMVSNVAGESVYSSCSEAESEFSRTRVHWGYTRLADHQQAHHFIGVLNE